MIRRHRQTETDKNNQPSTLVKVESQQKRENQRESQNGDWFRKFAHKTSEIVGTPWTFVIALAIIIGWAIVGPACGFSDTWQLVINTATTIVTFLMVFLIQNTQNRDAKAMHLKLDELIHAAKGARNKLINLENLSDEELAKLQDQFQRIGKARESRSTKQSESAEKR